MKNRIKDKLRSQTGASITYALLIFLVCAVVGSAVLVAGTTAAGRMSKVAENDQRYYAVNSAARLLIQEIDGRSVIIVNKTVEGGDPEYYKDVVSDAQITLDEIDSIPFWTAYQLMSVGTPTDPFYYDLTADGYDALAVRISETVLSDPYGEMTIAITKTTGTPSNDKTYSMILRFNLDKREIVDESKDAEGIKTTITTDTFTWNLRDIQVVGSGVDRGRITE